MTISVVLVVIAIITLGFGWLTGKDPMIYTSIGASVLAGLLLIKSVLDERKARAAAALAGTSTLSDRTDYTSSLDAEPVTFEEESTQLAVTPIGGYADDEDVEPFEEEEERVPATVAAGGRSRAKSSTASRAKPAVTKSKAASRAKTVAKSAKAKTSGAKAKPSAAKPKATSTKAKTSAKPKTAAKPTKAKTTGGAKSSAKTTKSKTSAKPKTAAKKRTTGR